jgi:hypothetical protein
VAITRVDFAGRVRGDPTTRVPAFRTGAVVR